MPHTHMHTHDEWLIHTVWPHIHTHMYTHTHFMWHTHTKHTCDVHTHTYTHTHSVTLTHNTHTHTHTHVHTWCGNTRSTYTHMHVVWMDTHSHTHIHIHIHTHTYTYVYTHTQRYIHTSITSDCATTPEPPHTSPFHLIGHISFSFEATRPILGSKCSVGLGARCGGLRGRKFYFLTSLAFKEAPNP